MSRVSPTLEGFRAAFRQPSLTLAEITWRWVVGATATALFFFGLFEFLNTLPVTRGEMLFLRTRHPYLVTQALIHILRGGFRRGVLSLVVAGILIALLWMIAASVGRIATLQAIIGYFRERLQGSAILKSGELEYSPKALESLVLLNFFRAAVLIATVFGWIGAGIIAAQVSTNAHPHPGLAFVVFLPIAALVGLLGWTLNWLLSLAAVFSVRDGSDAGGSIAAAIAFFAKRMGAILAVSSWVGLAHLVLFVAASTAVSIPLGLIPVVPWRLAVLAMAAVTLAYFAIADWLYMARLAAYVCITEMTDEMFVPLPPPSPPRVLAPLQTTIDRDELILSDMPHPA
ncbi:MAG TPA: hypothetical protein VJQ54_00570 [Candidatus Sulfotelmatobacter sp.]|nr:hypothetical protein [Candidatus Sulfotelmatobacter sp.]